ncbi:MAG: 3-phytase [Ponticaulis sp.]|nr:3-phytase [Ponticaulis sp.]
MTLKFGMAVSGLVLMTACASTNLNDQYAKVYPVAETEAVASSGDAADDPAIWVNSESPEDSRLLGTDKQAGLYVYDLSGAVQQFLPYGELNNVDLRQQVVFGVGNGVDLAAATNRTINGVSLFQVSSTGEVSEAGDFPVERIEPYGLCVGYDENGYRVFVTYKTGHVEIYEISKAASGAAYDAELASTLKLNTQLEGCSYDETQDVLFVGEEAFGLWRIDLRGNEELARRPIDTVESGTGLVADVEGVDIWRDTADAGYLVASAQEGDRYIVYERAVPNRWVGTFSIQMSPDELLDGVTHTDGLTISSAKLGSEFPEGLLVVQDDADGKNAESQNFKLVSWKDVIEALAAPKIAP